MKEKKMSVREWTEQVSVAFAGTLLGIVVTLGVTLWQQRKDQHEMGDKIAKMTLYNINLRIKSIEDHLDVLRAQKNAYDSIAAYMPDRLDRLNPDSLEAYYNRLNYVYFRMYDAKTEQIFGASIEVWQAFDDVKVISRLSNCYSIIDFCERQLDMINRYMLTASNDLKGSLMNRRLALAEEVRAFMEQPSTVIAIDMTQGIIPLIDSSIPVTREFNRQNIEAMGFSVEEIREIGNLGIHDIDINSTR